MKRIPLLALTLATATAISACNRNPGIETPPAYELSKKVEVVELEPAANGAKEFELRIAGDERYTFTDHAVALMMALDAGNCGGEGFGMGEGREDFPVGDERPAQGQALSIQVTCLLGTLPNHRIVETGSSTFDVIPFPKDKDFKAGSGIPAGDRDRTVDVVNRLLGDFVREAYTEKCAQGPMVIERIETATEAGVREYPEAADVQKFEARGPQTHAVLTYRCLEQETDGDA